MVKSQIKEKIRLTTREIIISLLDTVVAGIDFGDVYGYYRDYIRDYRNWRDLDKRNFYNALARLRKQDYIEKYQEGEKRILKLTPIGQKKAWQYLTGQLQIKEPKRWDKKWRMVIFDIPEDKKYLRDMVRAKLEKSGFYLLQKSVFVYPFECKELVFAIKYGYNLSSYLQYIVAENIETELDLVGYFYQQGILRDEHLQN